MQRSVLASAVLVWCACGGGAAVGYQGPLPSAAARATLTSLVGKTLPAGSVAFCPNEVRVHSFLVTPTMPAVIVDDTAALAPPPAGRFWIPVLEDGDIADLHRRATGSAPVWLATKTSAAYRRFMTGR